MQKNNLGLTALVKKTLAILGASTATLLNTSQAREPFSEHVENGKNLNVEEFKKRALKSKLVLKLKTSNINEGMVVMHTSHSSHRSHSSHSSHVSGSSGGGHYSHASHASHVSHYSSVPSYTTPSSIPNYMPLKAPSYSSSGSKKQTLIGTGTNQSGSTKPLAYYLLGSRTLFKGCRGTDVKELQQLLIKLGYDITADGYFGESTKTAVIDFQNSNYLTADGKVGPSTLSSIQIKAL